METTKTYCNNCEQPATGSFCERCGQRTSIDRVTFRETLQDFVDAVFSVNAPLFRTLRELFLRPGGLLRDFLSGKRKRYYKPVAFFILTTVVYLVIRSLINFDPFSSITSVQVDDGASGHKLGQARELMLANINKMLFIFVFTLAVFLKLFFYKKYSLAEYVVVAFYCAGIYTLFTTINMFFIQYVSKDIQVGGMILMWIYFIYAMVSFFQGRKWIVGLKAGLLFYIATFLYIFLAFGVSVLLVYLGF